MNITDKVGNTLNVGDDVWFSFYKGQGTIHKGKIMKITSRNVIVHWYCTQRINGELVEAPSSFTKRMVSAHAANLYLLKVTDNHRKLLGEPWFLSQVKWGQLEYQMEVIGDVQYILHDAYKNSDNQEDIKLMNERIRSLQAVNDLLRAIFRYGVKNLGIPIKPDNEVGL